MSETVSESSSLSAALLQASIDLPAAQIAQLDDYARRLWDWNAKINLTRHTTYDLFVQRDVVDSLKVAEQLETSAKILDVGSGGGVPGIILAIMRPDLDVTLSESMAKKAKVLDDIVGGMKLPVQVHYGRAEELLKFDYFDALVVRAVAPIKKLLTWFKPCWGAFGRLLVIKGPAWTEERREAREAGLLSTLQLRKKTSWPLPGTESESVLIEIQPPTGIDAS